MRVMVVYVQCVGMAGAVLMSGKMWGRCGPHGSWEEASVPRPPSWTSWSCADGKRGGPEASPGDVPMAPVPHKRGPRASSTWKGCKGAQYGWPGCFGKQGGSKIFACGALHTGVKSFHTSVVSIWSLLYFRRLTTVLTLRE